MKKIISLFILCLFFTGCSKGYEIIDTNKALELIDDGAIVIDVRDNSEYNTGHIVNAINIPINDIKNISYDKDDTLILYCATGIRSEEGLKVLHALGYTNLYGLDGGLLNWGSELEK